MRSFFAALIVFNVLLNAPWAYAQSADSTAPKEPVFASGGIRTKIVSVAAASDKQSVTIGALIENTSDDDELLAIVGQVPRAIDNKGNAFYALQDRISGIATCRFDPSNPQRGTDVCLDENNPQFSLAAERYTYLSKGASLTITFQFVRVQGPPQSLGDQFTFGSLVVVRQVTNYGVPGTKPKMGSPKIVSIGIPLIPLGS